MPDICKCQGYDCKMKEKCYRYTAKDTPNWQSYFSENPAEKDGTCKYYMEDYSNDRLS
jgi:hypothetical protein